MEPDELMRCAAEVCGRLGITYLVTGSIATIAYGEPRFTNDIDIALKLDPRLIDSFCDAFASDEFYLSRDAVREAVKNETQFNLIHPTSGLKIDFMVLSQTEFDKSRMARRRQLPVLEDYNVSFASPEDVILKKMVYYQEGGAEKHLRDIAGVLKVQGDSIDRNYIGSWAKQLEVLDVWLEILSQTESGS